MAWCKLVTSRETPKFLLGDKIRFLKAEESSAVPKKGCREGGLQYPLEPSPARVSAGNTASPFPETQTGPWLCFLVSPTASEDARGGHSARQGQDDRLQQRKGIEGCGPQSRLSNKDSLALVRTCDFPVVLRTENPRCDSSFFFLTLQPRVERYTSL